MLIDTNIFLEVQLDQKKASSAKEILHLIRNNTIKGYITDYSIDSIVLIMEHYMKSPEDIRIFLVSLLAYDGLEIYTLSIFDRIAATKHMQKLGLDYDDACQYQAMKTLKLTRIASFDADFDRVKRIKRITQATSLQ